jgi:hypothetical protein
MFAPETALLRRRGHEVVEYVLYDLDICYSARCANMVSW